jgi:DNA anti-recombination protein RmuC
VGAKRVETVEERVAYLEGKVEEHAIMVNDLRQTIVAFQNDVNRRFEQVEQRFVHLEERMDRRFEQMDLRLTEGFNRADARFEAMDAKMSRHFVWLAGMLLTTLIAMLGTLGAIIAATLR